MHVATNQVILLVDVSYLVYPENIHSCKSDRFRFILVLISVPAHFAGVCIPQIVVSPQSSMSNLVCQSSVSTQCTLPIGNYLVFCACVPLHLPSHLCLLVNVMATQWPSMLCLPTPYIPTQFSYVHQINIFQQNIPHKNCCIAKFIHMATGNDTLLKLKMNNSFVKIIRNCSILHLDSNPQS